ncbi:apoptosis-inducing factor homolog A-like [Phalaenopsis equestris]|uniref:apoptosis-inducing factor homolog A-like n=1 Tax=Phalaenopsis equestris TaxID=78828 RepID=UPI0009E21963|nr:apoptosis-inducing factor homolog A-like [Phalaenopsis equestris]
MEMDETRECVSEKKTVVVVGGGVAGALLAKLIQNYVHVTLIDPKEYFEMPWANLRSKIEPMVAERSLMNHSAYLTNGEIIESWAKNLTEAEVLTSDGHIVPYDYLVIASGHVVNLPRSRRSRLDQFQQDNARIKSARSILIIGGGPTGVELAGEIASESPEKNISLVHSGPRLLDFIGQKSSRKALQWLQSKKVQVFLNQSIDLQALEEAKGEYETSAGKRISADLHLVCVDRPMGSEWLQESFLNDQVDESGRLKVDDNLRVVGHKNIFAIGDITNVPELKQGFSAQQHAMVVAKNLKILTRKGKEKRLNKYRPLPKMAVFSMGKKNALKQGVIKSRDLFLFKTRRLMGLDRHSKRSVTSASDEISEGLAD